MITLDLYTLAVARVLRQRRTSTTRLMGFVSEEEDCISYNRAAFFLARMELEGIVGRVDMENRRDVLAWIQ